MYTVYASANFTSDTRSTMKIASEIKNRATVNANSGMRIMHNDYFGIGVIYDMPPIGYITHVDDDKQMITVVWNNTGMTQVLKPDKVRFIGNLQY